MHIPDAIIVGIIASIAAFLGASLSSWATLKSSKNVLNITSRQMRLQSASKIAEFRQAWINELRDSMAGFQSLGVTPNLDHAMEREFYRFGTKIELLMNRRDPNYRQLCDRMYAFLEATTIEEKFGCNAPYVRICQDILKNEWEVLKKDMIDASSDAPEKRL